MAKETVKQPTRVDRQLLQTILDRRKGILEDDIFEKKVIELLKNGADPNYTYDGYYDYKDDTGYEINYIKNYTAIYLLYKTSQIENHESDTIKKIFELLVNHCKDINLSIDPIIIYEKYIKNYSPLNYTSDYFTLIDYSILENEWELLEFLIENGANIDNIDLKRLTLIKLNANARYQGANFTVNFKTQATCLIKHMLLKKGCISQEKVNELAKVLNTKGLKNNAEAVKDSYQECLREQRLLRDRVLKQIDGKDITLLDFLQENDEAKLLEFFRNEDIANEIKKAYDKYDTEVSSGTQHYKDILKRKIDEAENLLSLDKINLGEIDGKVVSLATFWLTKTPLDLFKYIKDGEISQKLTEVLGRDDVKKHPFYENLDIHKARNEIAYELYAEAIRKAAAVPNSTLITEINNRISVLDGVTLFQYLRNFILDSINASNIIVYKDSETELSLLDFIDAKTDEELLLFCKDGVIAEIKQQVYNVHKEVFKVRYLKNELESQINRAKEIEVLCNISLGEINGENVSLFDLAVKDKYEDVKEYFENKEIYKSLITKLTKLEELDKDILTLFKRLIEHTHRFVDQFILQKIVCQDGDKTFLDFKNADTIAKLLPFCDDAVINKIESLYNDYKDALKREGLEEQLEGKIKQAKEIVVLHNISLGEINGENVSLFDLAVKDKYEDVKEYFENKEIYKSLITKLTKLEELDKDILTLFKRLIEHTHRFVDQFILQKIVCQDGDKTFLDFKNADTIAKLLPFCDDAVINKIESLYNDYKDALKREGLEEQLESQINRAKEIVVLCNISLGEINGENVSLFDLAVKDSYEDVKKYFENKHIYDSFNEEIKKGAFKDNPVVQTLVEYKERYDEKLKAKLESQLQKNRSIRMVSVTSVTALSVGIGASSIAYFIGAHKAISSATAISNPIVVLVSMCALAVTLGAALGYGMVKGYEKVSEMLHNADVERGCASAPQIPQI